MFSFAHVVFFPDTGHDQIFISTLIQKLAEVYVSAYGFNMDTTK